MGAHLRCLSYFLRHKWWVLVAGLRTGAPLWRLIVHDWSKLRPSEWFAYVDHFYRRDGQAQHVAKGRHYDPADGSMAFNRAWLFHQHRNPHHWQHWVLREDGGRTMALPMPAHFVREMVADWAGAGRAQTGRWGVKEWYQKNRGKMVLHPETERQVARLLRLSRFER